MPVIFRKDSVIDGLRPRIKLDTYQSPPRLAESTVAWIDEHFKMDSHKDVLDPGAGSGAWGTALRSAHPRIRITGVEKRRVKTPDAYNFWFQKDFLKWGIDVPIYDLVIGNPPYSHAEQFIYKSQSLLSDSGTICFLLNSNFAHGQGRCRGLFHDYRPVYIVSLAQRPQFVGPRGESLGKANTDTYVLMVWTKTAPLTTIHDWLDWS